MNILKSYKRVRVEKTIKGNEFGDGKDVPVGEYTVRHQGKFHTILWGKDKDHCYIISSVIFLTRLGRQIKRI